LTPAHAFRIVTNPRQPEPESRRDLSLEIALGFGIFLVVLSNCLAGLLNSDIFPSELQWPTLAVFVINLFHMPLLFMVQGHLASGTRRSPQSTLKRLFPTIVYPYFLWSILEGLVRVYLSDYTGNPASITSLYKILWIPIGHYWFLYALFFCQAGYLIIRKLSPQAQLAIAAIVFLAPQFFLNPILDAHLLIVLETIRGFLYFVLGAVSVAQIRQFGPWTAISATVLFALFSIIDYQSQLAGAIAAPAALPAGIAGIIATFACSRMMAAHQGWLVRLIAFCGRYWMSIYILHVFFTFGARIVLQRFAVDTWTPVGFVAAIEILTASVLAIALPLAINWVASKFSLDKWLGLPHMETS